MLKLTLPRFPSVALATLALAATGLLPAHPAPTESAASGSDISDVLAPVSELAEVPEVDVQVIELTGSVQPRPADGADSGRATTEGDLPDLADQLRHDPATEAGVTIAEVALDQTVVDIDGLRVIGATWPSDAGLGLALRSHDGSAWGPWQELELERAHDDPDARRGTDPVAVIGADRIELAIVPAGTIVTAEPDDHEHDEHPVPAAPADVLPQDSLRPVGTAVPIEISIIDPGVAASDSADTLDPARTDSGGFDGGGFDAAATTPPIIHSRAAWGADETRRRWRPVAGEVTGGIVHHTAGANNYTEAQVPAIIRGIYSYHADTLDWGDIGYNILIDRFGRSWEGRYGGVENPVIAAHALGANATTFGVGVLGHFVSTEVPAPAFAQLGRVIGWKFSVHGITNAGHARGPDGMLIPRVSGHSDVNATLCPGARMYNRLGELRGLVTTYQNANPPRVIGNPPPVRLAGPDRSATSVAVGSWTPQPGSTVFVATQADFADALAIGPIAARERSAVLLVQQNRIPAVVATELERRSPSRIVVLGSTEAISAGVLNQLRTYAPNVERVAGNDRYATAARIAERFTTPSQIQEVWIASGADFADALAATPAAARADAPLLLTSTTSLPQATIQALVRAQPDRVIVAGGEPAVAEAVLAQIRSTLPSATVTRIAGDDRYETAAAIAEHAWPGSANAVHYAQGGAWPDAVTGAASAGASGRPLLLVRQNCTPSATRLATQRLQPQLGYLLGSEVSIATGTLYRRC